MVVKIPLKKTESGFRGAVESRSSTRLRRDPVRILAKSGVLQSGGGV